MSEGGRENPFSPPNHLIKGLGGRTWDWGGFPTLIFELGHLLIKGGANPLGEQVKRCEY
jgi:hypothetical protein